MVSHTTYLTHGRWIAELPMARTADWRADPLLRNVPAATATAALWEPIEWRFEEPAVENPYDVRATATFSHEETVRTTDLFYDGNDTFGLRFTGTRPGAWRYRIESDVAELAGIDGIVHVDEEPRPWGRGFIRHAGNRWAWSDGPALVPQFVQYQAPIDYYESPESVGEDIETFIVEHGFTGFHSAPYLQWFDVERPHQADYDEAADDPTPDPRAFTALETLIVRTYRAGGCNYIWLWGAPNSDTAPTRWGLDSHPVNRLYRYIAARLGPLPGWIMGFAYDLPGWHHDGPELRDGAILEQWYDEMAAAFGWHHYLGARWLDVYPARPFPARGIGTFTDVLDYTSLGQHRVAYDQYVDDLEFSPNQPVLEADRFRVREQDPFGPKDYTPAMVRRGLWHATMAGGVANVWGYLLTDDGTSIDQDRGSMPFPNAEEVATYHQFWFERDRFDADLVRAPAITGYEPGVAITDDGGALYTALRDEPWSNVIAYAEATDTLTLDLTAARGPLAAVAVDTRSAYTERPVGTYEPGIHEIEFPSTSDWAIALAGD